ncbi:MAG: MlaD protein [Verrucomicrobiota bacterium]|jgi:ABC-type transporter Mla subunit MlaD
MPLQDLTPQLRTRLNKMERAVGWFVFIAAALLLFGFGYYIYHTAEHKGWFKTKAQFVTYVQSSAGLKVGDPIFMMGFQVGNITLVHPLQPGDKYNVEVRFEIVDPYFRYIWSKGSFVKVNGGFLGQSQLEITRGTSGGYALAVTQPIFHKTIDELKQVIVTESNRWQLSQYVFNSQSNAVFIPYQPYDGLTLATLDQLAVLNLESNSVYAYDNTLHSKHIVAKWNEDLKRYEFYSYEKNGPIELPAQDSVPVADRIDRIVGQVEGAIPGILALTNQLTAILNNAVVATSNLNTTLVSANSTIAAAQPMLTNFAVISGELREPGSPLLWALGTNGHAQIQGALTNLNSLLVNTDTNLGALLINLSDITGSLSAQVRGNTNLVGGIYKTIVDADDMLQGLKRHWLLRSAFKTNQPPTKTK